MYPVYCSKIKEILSFSFVQIVAVAAATATAIVATVDIKQSREECCNILNLTLK